MDFFSQHTTKNGRLVIKNNLNTCFIEREIEVGPWSSSFKKLHPQEIVGAVLVDLEVILVVVEDIFHSL